MTERPETDPRIEAALEIIRDRLDWFPAGGDLSLARDILAAADAAATEPSRCKAALTAIALNTKPARRSIEQMKFIIEQVHLVASAGLSDPASPVQETEGTTLPLPDPPC